MNTINPKLSKRLAPYLKDIETEYYYHNHTFSHDFILSNHKGKQYKKYTYIKTLTLEEAIELLPAGTGIYFRGGKGQGTRWEITLIDSIIHHLLGNVDVEWEGETLLETIEKMLEYLLDDNIFLLPTRQEPT